MPDSALSIPSVPPDIIPITQGGFGVSTFADVIEAGRVLNQIRGYRKSVEGVFKPSIEHVRAAQRGLSERMKSHLLDADKAEDIIRREVQKYIDRGGDVSGTTFHSREKYVADVYDLRAIAFAVISGDAPIEWLLPNQDALDSVANRLRGGAKIPGTNVVKRTTPVFRGEA